MKRGPLKRLTPLRSKKQLQRYTRMTLTRSKPKQIERYRDSTGLAFDEVRAVVQKHYGPRTSDWPAIKVVDDSHVCEFMHDCFFECWECEWSIRMGYCGKRVEAHHIIGAARRSDEFCNIAMLCNKCHENVKTDLLPQGRILFLKWREDRQHCDWVRLTLLRRQFLPELIA